jgi:alkylation response protein AidB-like acyl-CoA dehydrogenase
MSAITTTVPSNIPQQREPLARARELAPMIREAAGATERDRRVAPTIIEALREAGLFRMFLPRDLGGDERDPVAVGRAIEEISAADGSTGWCVMIAAQNASFAGLLPAEEARRVWGDGGIVAGTVRPNGRFVSTGAPGEGYLVSGRWPIASGSSHATWFVCEGVIHDGAAPRTDAQGNALTTMTLIPRDQVSIIDTWDTLGLRGTASNDFVAEGAFVPAARCFQLMGHAPFHPWPLYRALALAFVPHGSQALGVARAAIEAVIRVAATKPASGAPGKLRDQPRLQLALAEAVALRESASAFLYEATDACWQGLLAGDDDPRRRARVRLATSHAVRASVQVVDLMHAAVGASGILTSNPIERHFRDIHTAAAHVMIGPVTLEAAGRVELGLPAAFPFF